MLIFSFGSLTNESSLRQTSATAKILGEASLYGYQRKLNAISDAFPDVAMNLTKVAYSSVLGAVIDFPESDIEKLKRRESGYELVDVSDSINPKHPESVYCFIAPDIDDYKGKKAYRSYINTCLEAIPPEMREEWLEETIIECDILEDSDNPQYKPLS